MFTPRHPATWSISFRKAESDLAYKIFFGGLTIFPFLFRFACLFCCVVVTTCSMIMHGKLCVLDRAWSCCMLLVPHSKTDTRSETGRERWSTLQTRFCMESPPIPQLTVLNGFRRSHTLGYRPNPSTIVTKDYDSCAHLNHFFDMASVKAIPAWLIMPKCWPCAKLDINNLHFGLREK